MNENIKNLQSLGTMAAIHALFRHDCELLLADGLMFAEAGANVAANLVYTHSTSTQKIDAARARAALDRARDLARGPGEEPQRRPGREPVRRSL